jgi:pantothenate synthetase
MDAIFSDEPLARTQYISLVDPGTLQDLVRINSEALVSMAVYMGKTRLIDNTILGKPDITLDLPIGS